MAAWSFVIGVAPLVFADSAGAGAMRAIGICTMGGMLAATFVGIVFVPSLYALFQGMREFVRRRPAASARPAAPDAEDAMVEDATPSPAPCGIQ